MGDSVFVDGSGLVGDDSFLQLEEWGSTKLGSFLLYVVLATIGSKTDSECSRAVTSIYPLGVVVSAIHGALMLNAGPGLSRPFVSSFHSQPSQRRRPISAPSWRRFYQPGTAQIGVIMGVIGNVIGTYVGLFRMLGLHLLEKLLR